jgi:purine nucleoside phosphorylase
MTTESGVRVGIIGGSGLYQMPELTAIEEVKVDTPFGPPSDSFIVGTLEGERAWGGEHSLCFGSRFVAGEIRAVGHGDSRSVF